ncbi:MAG: LysR family transcriptional regulator [Bilifractor sp.]|jgi:DNA-binding transcriptional LysR family regulator
MTIQDLRYFVRICKKHSIAQAAEEFYITPQGLSKAIKRMEEELGTELLFRTQAGVVPTEYGQIFLTHAEVILGEYDSAQKEMDALKAQKFGLLKLVSAYGILRLLTPSFIHAFTDANNDIHLDYTEFPDSYIEEKVLNDEYDIGLTPVLNENPKLTYIPLFSKEIYFITHEGSRFYDQKEVRLSEVLKEPIVLENDHFLIHHILMREAAKEGASLIPYFNTSGFSLCYKLCDKGEANTASMDFIFEDMARDGLRKIPFTEHPQWPVCLIHKKDVPVPGSMKAFILHTIAWKDRL